MILKKLFGSGTLGGRAWRGSTEQARGSLTTASGKAGQVVVALVVEMLGRMIKCDWLEEILDRCVIGFLPLRKSLGFLNALENRIA